MGLIPPSRSGKSCSKLSSGMAIPSKVNKLKRNKGKTNWADRASTSIPERAPKPATSISDRFRTKIGVFGSNEIFRNSEYSRITRVFMTRKNRI
jgi:hypothetical protein